MCVCVCGEGGLSVIVNLKLKKILQKGKKHAQSTGYIVAAQIAECTVEVEW